MEMQVPALVTDADASVCREKKCIGDAGKKGAELSLLFLRENRVPVILISFRNRFLALAPAIARG
jgi:hypothetical protein